MFAYNSRTSRVAARPYSRRDPMQKAYFSVPKAAFSGERESERCDRRQWRMKGAERINRNKQRALSLDRTLCAD